MVKIGVLGAGGMGGVHANQYRKMRDVELHFYDPDPDRVTSYQERFGAIHVAGAEALIERVDIVDVCLPTDLHLEYGLKAIAAGRAVFMEKPMAHSLEEASQLIEAADKAGVPLMPGQVVRFFPEFRRASETVRSGKIGKPAAARTRRGGGAPFGQGGWFMDHSRSGGVLFDLAIHDFDWLRWTLGEVTQVYARSLGAATGTGPDYALSTLTFDSGALAHVEATWMDPSGFRVTFEVCGSEGMIEYDSRNTATLRTHVASGTGAGQDPGGATAKPKGGAEAPLSPTDDPYYQELRAFVDGVTQSKPLPVSPQDGWMAMSLALSALESAKTGKPVNPPKC